MNQVPALYLCDRDANHAQTIFSRERERKSRRKEKRIYKLREREKANKSEREREICKVLFFQKHDQGLNRVPALYVCDRVANHAQTIFSRERESKSRRKKRIYKFKERERANKSERARDM